MKPHARVVYYDALGLSGERQQGFGCLIFWPPYDPDNLLRCAIGIGQTQWEAFADAWEFWLLKTEGKL
jgi:hypothetical protein